MKNVWDNLLLTFPPLNSIVCLVTKLSVSISALQLHRSSCMDLQEILIVKFFILTFLSAVIDYHCVMRRTHVGMMASPSLISSWTSLYLIGYCMRHM